MTQGELSIAIYGDNRHMPNIYASLMNLVKIGIVNRTGEYPALYSLSGREYLEITKPKKEKTINLLMTNESIETVDAEVEATDNYGRENNLITECFKKYPNNTDIATVAMKIGLIDITNSTNISRYKRFISVVELAEIISLIPNIDERIKNGDPEVVTIIAKANGKINLFSFASKYCCYHNKNLYGRDDYSILDTVLKDSLPKMFTDIKKSNIQHWVDTYNYKAYNDYITRKLDEYGITISFRKRKFDHFVWFKNR
ncbi:MAG: hypothetical protein K2M08_01010 [Anaeroplasmataceae bacterium]|nr:hypothetical protein [Anaeroplasmataceae bacterium]